MNKIYNSFGFLFTKASNQLQERISDFLQKNQLTTKQMGMLLIIYDNDGITQKRAGEIQQVDRTTVTQIVDYLETLGYVARNKVENDRRAYGLTLSKRGVLMTELIYEEISKIQDNYLRKLNVEEIKTLKNMLILLTTEVENIE